MSNASSTGEGFLVGVEPAQPRLANDWPTQTPAQAVTQPQQQATVVPSQTGETQPNGRYFTEEEINRARQQEKDKLYPRLSQMEEQLKNLQAERDALTKQREQEAKQLTEEARLKEESALEVRDLLTRKEREWDERFQSLEKQREQDRAVYEKERRLNELEKYRQERIAQEEAFIIPELRDLIRGADEAEIDQAIEDAKSRSDAIFNNFTAVASQQTPIPRGASPTAPPVGPLEQMTNYQTLTPEDIRSMDIETYKRYRDSLLAQASQQYRGRR